MAENAAGASANAENESRSDDIVANANSVSTPNDAGKQKKRKKKSKKRRKKHRSSSSPSGSENLDDSSSTSSSSDVSYSSRNKSDWKINFSAFARTQTKLDTAIYSSLKVGTIVDAYFDKRQKSIKRSPWQDMHPMLGINPLHRFLYQPCTTNDPLRKESFDFGHIKYSDSGFAFLRELQTTNRNYYEANRYQYGAVAGSCLGTFEQIFKYPILCLNAFSRYCDTCKRTITTITRKTFKKLKKKCKRWLRKNQRIWEIIVDHLDVTSTSICSGIELSNGLLLLGTMHVKYSHTHAQCLAALLRELTNIQIKKKDDATGQRETIRAYMDRVQRIARDASAFPAMKVPIAEPLVKVFALEGVRRNAGDKYDTIVTNAYANDLGETFDTLTSKMETVEGLRAKQIHSEYGSTTTNLATASLQVAKNEDTAAALRTNGSDPNAPCDLPRHEGHTNGECSVKKLRALQSSGKAKPTCYDSNGKRICDFFNNSIRCPHKNCKYSHRSRGSKHDSNNRASTNKNKHRSSRSYIATSDGSNSDRSDSGRSYSRKSRSSRSHRQHRDDCHHDERQRHRDHRNRDYRNRGGRGGGRNRRRQRYDDRHAYEAVGYQSDDRYSDDEPYFP